MRIIAGTRRGHKLIEFQGKDIRPTTDRVKESVFNLIQDFVADAEVLDMFGGSGALTFESLSRGAKNAICVDISRESIDVIEKNARMLKFDNIKIVNSDAVQFIKTCNKSFSLIFLDPPYNKGFIEPIIDAIVTNGILSKDGVILLESDGTDEHGDFDGLEIYKQRKYGRSYVTLYMRR